jgi:hypothetical protein
MAEHGYTVTMLAASLGVTERTIFRWRADEKVPPAFLDLALAELLRRDGKVAHLTKRRASRKALVTA